MKKVTQHTYLVGILMLFAFWALGATSSPAQEPIKLRYFTGMTASHYYCAKMIPSFMKEIEKRTGGKVKFEFYPGGELYGYMDGMDAAAAGTVDVGLTSIGHWGGYNKIFLCTDFFLFLEDNDHWFRARDTIGPILFPVYEKQNVKVLHYAAYSEGVLGSCKPISKIEDMKGMKIRAPVPGALACIKAWGAIPTRIAAAETYDALSKGAIDANVTGWGSIYARKFYEVQDYYVGPIWQTEWVIFMNLKKWNSLPKDIQEVIREVSRETEELSFKLTKESDENNKAKIKKLGKIIRILTPEEKKQWGQPLKLVYDNWIKECAKVGYGTEANQIMEALIRTR
jgi:TRAP-type C4-dicarboxylate transport system substrate-binding protein